MSDSPHVRPVAELGLGDREEVGAQGIESMSLNPDTLVDTLLPLAAVEAG